TGDNVRGWYNRRSGASHGRLETLETVAFHDEPQGYRDSLPAHFPLLLRHGGALRPHLPLSARRPVEHLPPAGRVQPARHDPRSPHALVGDYPARRRVRELLRSGPNRRSGRWFTSVVRPHVLHLPWHTH